MVVDVGKRRQAERIGGADRGAQRGDVALRGGVAALVVRLGVDDQAVGALGDARRAGGGLAERVLAVDELPRADAQPAGVQRRDELRRELRPDVGARRSS